MLCAGMKKRTVVVAAVGLAAVVLSGAALARKQSAIKVPNASHVTIRVPKNSHLAIKVPKAPRKFPRIAPKRGSAAPHR